MKNNIASFPILSIAWVFLLLVLFTVSCSSPQHLPAGPTPIPTLIPATMPPSSLDQTATDAIVIESYPAGLPSALNGQALYLEHCASCHGVDGTGAVPTARNFGDVDYMRGETPAEFYSIITEGREETMPPFGSQLTSDERWDLVYFIWRFSTTDQILLEGYDIYQRNCTTCHGENGRSMILGAANFSDQRFITNQSPSDLYISITQGRESMPAWQARLSQDERWAVIDFIRTFSYAPQIGEGVLDLTSGGEPTVSERAECSPYIDLTNPFAWDRAEIISAGQALYENNCSTCHGEDGTGNLPGIIDFSDPIIHAGIVSNPGGYLCTITIGFEAMPSFQAGLTEDEIWQILTFIGSLGE